MKAKQVKRPTKLKWRKVKTDLSLQFPAEEGTFGKEKVVLLVKMDDDRVKALFSAKCSRDITVECQGVERARQLVEKIYLAISQMPAVATATA